MDQIVNKILEMTPEQVEKMKHFFGITDEFDIDMVRSQQSELETKLSSGIRSEDFMNLSEGEEDKQILYLADKLKNEVDT